MTRFAHDEPASGEASRRMTDTEIKVFADQTDTELKVYADPHGRPEWRVEYFDEDGACYVTLFAGPEAEQRAQEYHGALKSGTLKPIHRER